MKQDRLLTTVMILATSAIACGEEKVGAGMTPEQSLKQMDRASWDQYCTTTGQERAKRCDSELEVSSCQLHSACLESLVAPGTITRIAECLESRACDAGDDHCYEARTLGLTESQTLIDFQAACLSKHESCARAGTGFSDDWCFVSVARDEVISQIRPCLEHTCGSVSTCMEPMFDCAK